MSATLLTGPRVRALVTGGDPDERYPVPSKDRFVVDAWWDTLHGDDEEPERHDFIAAADVERIAAGLIGRHDATFRHLGELGVAYRWKRAGGASGGKATLGKCVKTSGLVKHFGGVAFVIWLAADHCRRLRLTRWQVEALVYRELLHTDRDDKGKPTVAPCDFQGFAKEIEHYGLWQPDLALAGRAIQGLQLPLFTLGEGDRGRD